MEDVGFPDFEQPFFFNDTSLPYSNLDKVSARYEARAITPWLANLSLTAYYQRTERLLQNDAAGAVPGAHAGGVLPDLRLPPRHPVRNRAARLDARRRPARGVRSREESPADHRRDVLSRSQQRPADDDDADVDAGAGGARRPRSGAGGVPVAGRPRPAVDRASGPRPRREPPRHRGVRAGRMARASRRSRSWPAFAAISTP